MSSLASLSRFGIHFHQTDAFVPLVAKCQAEGGVHIIDVPVDYSENDRILNTELPELSAGI